MDTLPLKLEQCLLISFEGFPMPSQSPTDNLHIPCYAIHLSQRLEAQLASTGPPSPDGNT